jgi:RNA polymerase sigma factor (sigma-70 family)
MIRTWLGALVKKVLSSKALQRAPQPARRVSVRPRLEALEERLTTSVSELGPAVPVSVAVSAAVVAPHGADTPLPSPTPVGAGYGTAGWERLLQDVFEPNAISSASGLDIGRMSSAIASENVPLPDGSLGALDPATAFNPTTISPPSVAEPVTAVPPPAVAAETASLPGASPPDVALAQRPADLRLVPPPNVDEAESGTAQQSRPEPAARTETIGPAHESDHSNGAGAAPAARNDSPPTSPPRYRDSESAPADSGVTAPLLEDRVPTRNRGTASAAASTAPARLSDDVLLRQYVTDGDQAAFSMIVRQHERVVLRTCQRVLGDPHLAQEAVQATFMVLARKAGVLEAGQPLTPWLCKVAFRTALRLRAALARRRRREKEAPRRSGVVAPPSADLERDEIFQALSEELQGLPEKYRAPLVLCYLDGRTHGEAAQLIGLPRGSMAKRIREALRRLRERMAARGFVG